MWVGGRAVKRVAVVAIHRCGKPGGAGVGGRGWGAQGQ